MDMVVVLASSLREANVYCQDKGIRAVFAQSSAQVAQSTRLIQLPGFLERRDRFALAAARDARIKYGRPAVEFIDEVDWVAPVKPIEEIPDPPQDLILPLGGLPFGDLHDEANLDALKAALNEVGLTLKKLPKKTPDEAPVVDLAAALRTSLDEVKSLSEAPVVDAPVEF